MNSVRTSSLPACGLRSSAALRTLVALAATALCAAALTVAASPAAAAGPFVVDTASDDVDAVVGDGLCAAAGGSCTLRAAVQEANAAPGTVTSVTFAPAVTDVLLTVAGPGGAEAGDLDVDPDVDLELVGNVVVVGGGAPDRHTVVDASALGDRILDVAAGASVSIRTVSLIGGSVTGDGGGIRTAGDVLVRNDVGSVGAYVALSSNSATGAGGAVAVLAGGSLDVKNASTVATPTRVDISDNLSALGGGAIANLGGTVTLTGDQAVSGSADVYVDANTSADRGGAVWNSAGTFVLGCRAFLRFSTAPVGGDLANSAAVELSGGGIDAGRADVGGGIANAPSGTIAVRPGCGQAAATRVIRSTAAVGGGGIANDGSLVVDTGATLSIEGDPGQADAVDGGGLLQAAGTVDVDGLLLVDGADATIGGGVSVTGGTLGTGAGGRIEVTRNSGGDGGGVAVSGGVLSGTVLLSDNTTPGSGGNLFVSGGGVVLSRSAVLRGTGTVAGGLFVKGGSFASSNTTFAGNGSLTPGAAVSVIGGTALLRHVTVAANASGISVTAPGAATLERSLLARNGDSNCAAPTGVTVGDFNVFDDGDCGPTGTDFTDASRFDQVDSRIDDDLADDDPNSFGLQDGHPAIDFVTDGGCGTPADDQVGASRPDGTACDAGAIEGGSGTTRPVTGAVSWEPTAEPLADICVIALAATGDDDPRWGRTDVDGTYEVDVPDGTYLLAFYEPAGSVPGPAGCDTEPDPSEVHPEWFRNVAVTFDADDGSPELPDPAEVTLITVAGSGVDGIDACLGPGPDAGADAPCPSGSPDPTATPEGGTENASTGRSSTGGTPLAFAG